MYGAKNSPFTFSFSIEAIREVEIMTTYKIVLIPGDGIGPEVIAEGVKVLESAGEIFGINFDWHEYPYGAEYYLKTGVLLPDEDLKEWEKWANAIYLGAIGHPKVDDTLSLHGILLKIRFYFDQYVNLRPIKLLKGVSSPLMGKNSEDINFIVIRENTEDFYVGLGGEGTKGKNKAELNLWRRLFKVKFNLDIETNAEEIAYQIGLVSKEGCERVFEYSFKLAKKLGRKKVTSVDKINAMGHIYGYWRSKFLEIGEKYPEIEKETIFADAAAMWFVKAPEKFDVVVTPNFIGDILTDLGAAISGGMGFAAGANINPEGISMFEPIHGSAPKYKGKNIANPIATIWSGALMLDHLGHHDAYKAILKAIETVLSERKVVPKDLGGDSKTGEIGDAIVEELKEMF